MPTLDHVGARLGNLLRHRIQTHRLSATDLKRLRSPINGLIQAWPCFDSSTVLEITLSDYYSRPIQASLFRVSPCVYTGSSKTKAASHRARHIDLRFHIWRPAYRVALACAPCHRIDSTRRGSKSDLHAVCSYGIVITYPLRRRLTGRTQHASPLLIRQSWE